MRKEPLIVLMVVSLLAWACYTEVPPIRALMDWRTKRKALAENAYEYQVYDYTKGESSFITVDFRTGKHFWNPQMVIWLEDTAGKHIATLFVTTSTAKGLFYGGRTTDNYQDFDGEKAGERAAVRRVNALPYWSYKRGVRARDGSFAPHQDEPLPDAISGATPQGNFYLKKSLEESTSLPEVFKVMMEVNVAFDQNAYFSEYDFLEDAAYHGGTGLLGQPSLIYGKTVKSTGAQQYYVLELIGHGHHSGQNGALYTDLSGITTAKAIVERVVVGIKF